MAIKDIVLHQGLDSRSQARLEVAIALAKAHDARIIGVFVGVGADALEHEWTAIRADEKVRLLSNFENESNRAEEVFRTRMGKEGLASEWRAMDGDPTEIMTLCARYGDLTVIGQTNPEEPLYDAGMPDHVILGAGGPVLVVPYVGKVDSVGRRVMIAWNGSREAARAVQDAIPLLQRAKSVVVYGIEERGGHHISGHEICAFLTRHGIAGEIGEMVVGAEAKAVDPSLTTVGGYGFQQQGPWTLTRHHAIGEISAGDALLSAVTDYSIDMLVMGAYGHSRVRELVLGGATQLVLKTMTVPVMFSK